MFERPDSGNKAILVQVFVLNIDFNEALEEFKELALSANVTILDCVSGSQHIPDAKYFLRKGKVEEIKQIITEKNADVVLINHELSPSQERNLEKLFQCRVVDRSGLILDIFAQRAQTFEGKLQVELAQLQHLSTRLIRGWTHLERQKGGIGLRGPGETQLETDRRLIRKRIKTISERLEKVRNSRNRNRQSRRKQNVFTVSLVGYTNAGKSTLFNALTKGQTFVANQLFATLDPTLRKLDLPGVNTVILSDTVGFIRDLPHHLIEAFRATLEETQQADLLLHVIDIANPQWRDMKIIVQNVLADLGIKEIPIIYVFNKIDLYDNWQPKKEYNDNICKVWVSASSSLGLDLLKEAIVEQLFGYSTTQDIIIKASQPHLRAKLYQLGSILTESLTENGDWLIRVKIPANQRAKFLEDFGLQSNVP